MIIQKSGKTIQSLLIAYNILELIASHGNPMKFNEIYDVTKITKSNLHKYLNTLTSVGMLYRDKETGLYSLGSKLAEYGMKALNQENVIERATPFLQEINQACKNTVLLLTWSQNGPVVVKLINSLRGLNVGAQIGMFLPVMSATAKVFLAFMDEAETREWKAQQTTGMSEEQKQQIEEQIQYARKYGIAFTDEPYVPSVYSISLPIFNFEKRLLGVIAVVGFPGTIARSIDDVMSQYLLKINKEISAAFGFKS